MLTDSELAAYMAKQRATYMAYRRQQNLACAEMFLEKALFAQKYPVDDSKEKAYWTAHDIRHWTEARDRALAEIRRHG